MSDARIVSTRSIVLVDICILIQAFAELTTELPVRYSEKASEPRHGTQRASGTGSTFPVSYPLPHHAPCRPALCPISFHTRASLMALCKHVFKKPTTYLLFKKFKHIQAVT